jgi:Raf kinase inhibitor-like YbhB/YbcL family protein
MRLTSAAFEDGAEIPAKYTCDGANVSPPLTWSEVPATARSLALVVDDPDAPDPASPTTTWVHWVILDLPPDSHGLKENVGRLAHGGFGANDWDRAAWGGPCPPRGRHRYMFKLYALDRVLELARPSKADLERAMIGHVVATATLVGTYQKRTHAGGHAR